MDGGVDGAGNLTVVAAEGVVLLVEVGWQLWGAVLDGIIGGAAPCIDEAVGMNGVVGAGMDAASAVVAGTLCLWEGLVVVVGRECGDYFAEEEVGAVAGMDEEAVACYPSEACALGPVAVADGCGIDEGAEKGFKILRVFKVS